MPVCEHGEGAGGGILLPALPGTVVGAEQVAIIRRPQRVLVFGCRHGEGEG